jgi:hypothetical protein
MPLPNYRRACSFSGTNLPYTYTSIEMVGDSNSQQEVFNKLRMWSGLQNVPRCWDVIQPFLCGIYLPRYCLLLLLSGYSLFIKFDGCGEESEMRMRLSIVIYIDIKIKWRCLL